MRTFYFKYLFYFILFCISSLTVKGQIKYEPTHIVLEKLHLKGIDQDTSNSQALQLVQIWDSLYPNNKHIIYNMLPGIVWEEILLKQYKIAQKNRKKYLQLKLAFPLATIYHVQAKSEALPVLEFLYANRTHLSRSKDSMVLIKLEEQYRNKKDLAKAILIRNERIEKSMIVTFWELYKEAGMYQAALDDYVSFEPLPKTGTIERLKYFNHLGLLYYEMKLTNQAIQQFNAGLKEAETILEQEKNTNSRKYELALFYKNAIGGNIGMAYMLVGDFINAIPLLKKDIQTSNIDIDNKINKTVALGNCYLNLKDYITAQKCVDTASFYLIGKDDKLLRLKFYALSSNVYKAKGLINDSYFYLNKYSNLRDTFSALLQQQQASLLLTKLEIEKRRKNLLQSNLELSIKTKESNNQQAQLKILVVSLIAIIIIVGLVLWLYFVKVKSSRSIHDQNNQLKTFASKIQFQNERNEILLKELHHRVKNNLQLMYSLLGMQKRRINSPVLEETIVAMQNRIQSMAFMHDQLYVSGEDEMVDFESYVLELINHIRNIYIKDSVNVDFTFDIQIKSLVFDKAILLGLILNEIITNAYKYAFRPQHQGELLVRIYVDDANKTIVEVQDNGPGFSIEPSQKGLGVKIITTLVNQLDGQLHLESKGGVYYTIEFKA